MGFVEVGETKFFGFTASSGHKRSKSFPGKNRAPEDGSDVSPEVSRGLKQGVVHVEQFSKTSKKLSSNSETHDSLKQEILQLEKRLQNQFQVRHVLEKALGYQTPSHDNASEISMPKPATELIKEITTLELEVAHLEQYLLSLYRKAFDQQVSSVSPSTKDGSSKDKRLRTPKGTPRARLFGTPPSTNEKRKEDSAVPSSIQPLEIPLKDAHDLSEEEKLLHSGVHRCYSALSHRSALEVRISPQEESLGKAVRACHSQPLSMIEFAQKAGTSVVSLAEYLGTTISDHVPESANRLSEDMIKCMSTIYCKLADPPLANHGLSSPNSSLSSASAFSPQDQSDMGSPGFRNNSSFDVRLDNPFHVEGLKEFSGPYSTMVEVPWIQRDSQKLGDIENLLQNYRSLICRLEEVDLRKLRHEEKLAFWINVHNALVMHAFLSYGIPQNNMKRVFQLLKAAYNVGGHTISADTIQSTILGCRMSRPGQWLRLLLSPKKKFKTGDERQAYGIKHSEPLLHFALCFGSHSDPAVRVYTPKRLFQELETAKVEYVRATFGVRKDKKILLPKTVESFTKESGLCTADIIDMVQKCLPDSLRKSLKKCPVGKLSKSIEWIPYNFSFRYLIAKELAK